MTTQELIDKEFVNTAKDRDIRIGGQAIKISQDMITFERRQGDRVCRLYRRNKKMRKNRLPPNSVILHLHGSGMAECFISCAVRTASMFGVY